MSVPITPKDMEEEDKAEFVPVEGVYKRVGEMSEAIKKPRLVTKDAIDFAVTKSGNILFSNPDEGFQIFSMQAQKIFFTSDTGHVTAFHVTPSNSRFYIGYDSGLLECRVPNSLAVESKLELKSDILAITSDDKVVYVTCANGKIIYFRNFHMEAANVTVLKGEQDNQDLTLLKLSADNNFLIAYNDVDDHEEFYVFSTAKGEQIWMGHLDLHPRELREDPNKLLVIS
mmetsp:Transcript_7742/g.7185  ORF Transcript_7742/g.7185 Transcript_7742/m.7185 type:complete len:228 (+) Transcript_7742:14-697(+)